MYSPTEMKATESWMKYADVVYVRVPYGSRLGSGKNSQKKVWNRFDFIEIPFVFILRSSWPFWCHGCCASFSPWLTFSRRRRTSTVTTPAQMPDKESSKPHRGLRSHIPVSVRFWLLWQKGKHKSHISYAYSGRYTIYIITLYTWTTS